MRSRTAHQLDEVPIFLCRVAVALDVADNLRINLSGSVETKRGFNHFVLQVAVDSLRAANHLNANVLCLVVFGKHTSVGVRVVTTNDNYSLDVEFLKDYKAFFELFWLFELCTTRTNDVEATGVAIFVDNFRSELNIIVVNQTAGAHQETIQTVCLVDSLDAIKQTANHIVSTRSLTTRQNNAYVELSTSQLALLRVFFEGQLRKSISVWEQSLDFFLVGYRLGWFTLYSLHSTPQRRRKLWLILRASHLQCTFFCHFCLILL